VAPQAVTTVRPSLSSTKTPGFSSSRTRTSRRVAIAATAAGAPYFAVSVVSAVSIVCVIVVLCGSSGAKSLRPWTVTMIGLNQSVSLNVSR
jgi:hypothetical protein